jgi:aspartate/methionine/tyrosine aminotransferase
MPELGYEIMRKQISGDNHGYTMTPGVPAAREAILKLYKPKNPISINNITIQHGVNQGLYVILMSFTNPGDEILVPEIGYPIFEKLAPGLGVKVVHYKLKS